MPSIDSKKKTQQNKLLYIFLTVFFVTLVTLIYLATAFTPDVDVDVNSDDTEVSDTIDKQDVDNRLRSIQQDELIGAAPNRKDAESSSEIFEQLKKMKAEALSKQASEDINQAQQEEITYQQKQQAPKPNLAAPSYNRQPAQVSHSAKVYVGRYSDFDQAIKVQDALIQSSYASAPFVKNMGGYYVIQIGSFSNPQTAQNVVEQLISGGYQARMVLE